MTDFQNPFTVSLSKKFAIKISLQIPPHGKALGGNTSGWKAEAKVLSFKAKATNFGLKAKA